MPQPSKLAAWLRHNLPQTLVINSIIAAIAVLLAGRLFSRPPRQTLQIAVVSMVYSQIIGTLISVSIGLGWVEFKSYHKPWNWIFRILFLLILAAVGTMLANGILVTTGYFPKNYSWNAISTSFQFTLVFSVLMGLAAYLLNFFEQSLKDVQLKLRTKELEEERARKLATEARLASLESRIHPHFLFNTLNSISALIPEDPQRAERLVEQLAALLRFCLDVNQRSLVPLAQELKITRDYLEIESVRLGNRLKFQLDVSSDFDLVEIPPLTIQTLVENSIKFAIAPRRMGGTVTVQAFSTDAGVTIEVTDDGPGFDSKDIQPGHGIDNVKSRLQVLFGDEADFQISSHSTGTSVSVSVPFHRRTEVC